jgi:hypothetical protein
MLSVFKHKNPFSEKMKGVFFVQPDAFFFRQFITQARWLMA